MTVEQPLRRLRADMTRFWLNAPAADLEAHYAGEAGDLHHRIATGPLKDMLLSENERWFAEQGAARIRAGVRDQELARVLLVTMLYLRPHEIPPCLDVMKLPEWLRAGSLEFQLTLPGFLNDLGEADAYAEHLERVIARLHEGVRLNPGCASWQQLAAVFAEKASLQPLYFSRRDMKAIAVRRADIVDHVIRLKRHDLPYAMPPRSNGTLRIGIHSWSLRPHTETFASLPLFEHLDSRQFDVHLYIHQSDGNPIEQRARGLVKRFTVLPETLKACVATIRKDDLDVLVFGNNITTAAGYAFNLANYRMARVQCIHFCNPATSGKRHIDGFLLGQLIADHLDTDTGFSERILPLEGSGICFDLTDAPVEVTGSLSRRELGIPDRGVVFISGANYHKIIPELRHTWAKILVQVPDSVLLLYPFGPAWSHHYPQQRLIQDITRIFNHYGIPSERVVITRRLQGREDILALNRIADVYLDAVPYNGATSLLDPLQEGVPPVVLDGRELRFSQGAAMLRELGVPELVARDEEGYIRLAVLLATDATMRESIRRLIRARMSRTPAFLNPRLYAERVTRALRSLFPESQASGRSRIGSHARLDFRGNAAL